MLLVHACPRCHGALATSLDGYSCLACGHVLYQTVPVTHAAYHVGRCAICRAHGTVYRRYVGDLLLWCCSRCDGILGRKAKRPVVDNRAGNRYTSSGGAANTCYPRAHVL